jgi:hypothetical protein
MENGRHLLETNRKSDLLKTLDLHRSRWLLTVFGLSYLYTVWVQVCPLQQKTRTHNFGKYFDSVAKYLWPSIKPVYLLD